MPYMEYIGVVHVLVSSTRVQCPSFKNRAQLVLVFVRRIHTAFTTSRNMNYFGAEPAIYCQYVPK